MIGLSPLAGERNVVAQIGNITRRPFDPDKARDGRLDAIRHRGVWLVSRYGKRHELATMQAAADWLYRRGPHGGAVVGITVEIFCDSKLGQSYWITCHDTGAPVIASIAEVWSAAFVAVGDRHNGVTAQAGGAEADAPAEAEFDGPGGVA